jgi:leucyl aminopeptidase (aminopeptidase T)
MMDAASQIKVTLTTIIMRPRTFPGEEPPESVVAAMKSSDVVICATSMTMFYTKARIAACRAGARLISMAGATPSLLASRAMLVNFDKQEKLVKKIAAYLTRASVVHVRTDRGTDLRMDISNRSGCAITALCTKSGDAQGAPDIEACVAPLEASTNGKLVVDASTSVTGLLRTPITIDIEHGTAIRIHGGTAAKRLKSMLFSTKKTNSFKVAEFGVGLNPFARLCGSIIVDEAVLGTAHIALGDNIPLGGKNHAPIHVDLVFKQPKIELDGKLILNGHRFLV